ncbi:splicing factor U2AF U2 SNRNP auxiliary factor [Cryptosporidium ubiquitum]|uniref:Splicing factor U2AF U2 SNRNP auxiliary factor n=1 Tax=Cryptosporidium ubiquitum TaxID=857276 RepID=A0A1J4MFQ0_9CRYT|nr:splicing factor U2AF U2 SNRNP auxiliary factor [Cryptosporidium ubiquitum]OII73062.1 splicing factor U2AF U2 SNRNP auxiliary factor [Cryptosporidium ubiquitum]
MQFIHQDELDCSNTSKSDKKSQISSFSDEDDAKHLNEIGKTNSIHNNNIRIGAKVEHLDREYDINRQENSSKKLCSSKYLVNNYEKACSDLNQYELMETTPVGSVNLNSVSTASKSLREVYVGNLPQGLTVTELLEYINRSMTNNNVSPITGNPVISAWINSDGKYAFCECRSIEEANILLKLNNLLSFKGNLLRIGKPKVSENNIGDQLSNSSAIINQIIQNTTIISSYFNNIPLIFKKKETILITGINKAFTIERVKEIFADNKKIEVLELIDYRNKYKIAICELDSNTNLADRIISKLGTEAQILKMKNFNSKILYTINDYLKSMVNGIKENNELLLKSEIFKHCQNKGLKSLLIPQKPCRCILLSKILTVEELLIPSVYSSVYEEIHKKCLKYGDIYKTTIPKPEKTPSSKDQCIDPYFGRAFIFFFSVESAIRAKVDLFKMRFLGRNIKITYYCEHEFLKGNLISCEPNRCDPIDDKEFSKIINLI